MKKKLFCLLIAIVVLSLNINTFAESCPLPDTNSDSDILFNGFDWYTDYATTLKAAKAKGISNNSDWSRDSFVKDKCVNVIVVIVGILLLASCLLSLWPVFVCFF